MQWEDMDTAHTMARVQERAYYLWSNEGRPSGKDLKHWLQAEREIFMEKKQELAENRLGPRPSAEAELISIKIRPVSGSGEAPDSYPELGDIDEVTKFQKTLLAHDDFMLVLHDS